jgi:hypothetical protein
MRCQAALTAGVLAPVPAQSQRINVNLSAVMAGFTPGIHAFL